MPTLEEQVELHLWTSHHVGVPWHSPMSQLKRECSPCLRRLVFAASTNCCRAVVKASTGFAGCAGCCPTAGAWGRRTTEPAGVTSTLGSLVLTSSSPPSGASLGSSSGGGPACRRRLRRRCFWDGRLAMESVGDPALWPFGMNTQVPRSVWWRCGTAVSKYSSEKQAAHDQHPTDDFPCPGFQMNRSLPQWRHCHTGPCWDSASAFSVSSYQSSRESGASKLKSSSAKRSTAGAYWARDSHGAPSGQFGMPAPDRGSALPTREASRTESWKCKDAVFCHSRNGSDAHCSAIWRKGSANGSDWYVKGISAHMDGWRSATLWVKSTCWSLEWISHKQMKLYRMRISEKVWKS